MLITVDIGPIQHLKRSSITLPSTQIFCCRAKQNFSFSQTLNLEIVASQQLYGGINKLSPCEYCQLTILFFTSYGLTVLSFSRLFVGDWRIKKVGYNIDFV